MEGKSEHHWTSTFINGMWATYMEGKSDHSDEYFYQWEVESISLVCLSDRVKGGMTGLSLTESWLALS